MLDKLKKIHCRFIEAAMDFLIGLIETFETVEMLAPILIA